MKKVGSMAQTAWAARRCEGSGVPGPQGQVGKWNKLRWRGRLCL